MLKLILITKLNYDKIYYICSIIKNRKIHMRLSIAKYFDHLAGSFPAKVSGCYMYFYEIKM